MVVVGIVVVGHVEAEQKLEAEERAKAASFDPAKIRAATSVPTTGTAPSRPATPDPLTIARPMSTTVWDRQNITFVYDGLTRHYLVYRPRTVTVKVLPIVVHISGSDINPAGEVNRVDYLHVASQAIIVYPGATDLAGGRQWKWDAGACCGEAATDKVDDVGFIEAVIAQVKKQADASPGPVYLSGYSNGGKMALLLACDDAAGLAAVAVYGAVPTFTCPHPKAVSVLEMVGTADPEMTIGPGGTQEKQGGFIEPRVTTVIDAALRDDGCTSGRAEGRAGSLDELMWSSCTGGRRVGLAIWAGLAHAWPQGTPAAPSATQVSWDWFESLGAGDPLGARDQ